MAGFPPPPGRDGSVPPPPPPGGPLPPPGTGGWPAPPPRDAPGVPAPPGRSLAAAPGAYGPPPGYGAGPYAEKAGFWTRFAAALIDSVVTGLFTLPAYIALWTGDTKVEACSVDESGDFDPTGTVDNGLCEVPTAGTWAIFGVLIAAAVVATVVYFAKLEGGSGQTVGKRALGVRVVDARTGGPIGTGRGVGRYFGRILSSFICFLGYLWMLWDPQKQTWHDKVVNSFVVKV